MNTTLPRHHLLPTDPPAATSCDQQDPRAPVAVLEDLLDRLAVHDLEDPRGWSDLAAVAAVVLGRLVGSAHLPAHLGVTADEPPVLIRRTAAVALRHLQRRAAAG